MPALGFIGLAAVFLVVASFLDQQENVNEPTQLSSSDGKGVVIVDGAAADPRALAAGMGVEANRYALARMINSEFSRYRDARIGCAWCARNEAAARGVSVLALLTRQRVKVDGVRAPGPGDGYFGAQWGRYASTAQDTTADALDIADGVISGELEDPTGGARQFDSPGAFGEQPGTEADDADKVAQSRIAAGNELVTLPGVPLSYARFWRPIA
jgi:hypothetical protein